MGNCRKCKKPFIDKRINRYKHKMFCSRLCQTRYSALKNHHKMKNNKNFKKYKIKKFKRWYYQNKDKQKVNVLNDYYKNKEKWNSRKKTYSIILHLDYTLHPVLKLYCKKCKCKNNLTIHHEVYPTDVKSIIKAIDKGLIYYLCKKCHNKNS